MIQSKSYSEKSALENQSNGFSLIELLAVLSILALVLSFAIPAMQTSFANTELKKTADKLLQNIELARAYALANYSSTTLCPVETDSLSKEKKCSGDEWESGYGIELADKIIHSEPELGNQTIRIIMNTGASLTFNGGGFLSGNTDRNYGVCSSESNRLYWIAIRESRAGYLGYQPFMCVYQIKEGDHCSQLTSKNMNASDVSGVAELVDGQSKKDCHN